jgi:hypothetical protein
MALILNENSYVDVAGSDLHFADRVNGASWLELDDLAKEPFLVTATRMIDDEYWIGVVAEESQPLAFPRVFSYFEPRLGKVIDHDGSTIPQRIIEATCELAFHLFLNPTILESASSVTEIKVGPVELIDIKGVDRMPATFRGLVKPLERKVSMQWWRAN